MSKTAIIISVLVGAFVIYAYGTNTKAPAAHVGDTVKIIAGQTSDEVPVAATKEADDEFSKVLNAKDEHGYNQLFASGKMFRVNKGTKALVIERSYTMAQVRILEGSHEGKAGWVPVEFAVKADGSRDGNN